MTIEARILSALGDSAATDTQLAALTGLPEPSVRRVRLSLVRVGTLMGNHSTGWRKRYSWEMPESKRYGAR